jgi:hypothetical protein
MVGSKASRCHEYYSPNRIDLD